MARGFLRADAKEGAQGGGIFPLRGWGPTLDKVGDSAGGSNCRGPAPAARMPTQLSLGVALGGWGGTAPAHAWSAGPAVPTQPGKARRPRQAGRRPAEGAGASWLLPAGSERSRGGPQGTRARAAAEAHAWEELRIQPRFIEDLLGAGRVTDAATYGIPR